MSAQLVGETVKVLPAPEVGMITMWLVQPEQYVGKNETLAIFVSARGMTPISTPAGGVVIRLLVAAGTPLEMGTALALIMPSAPPLLLPECPQARQEATTGRGRQERQHNRETSTQPPLRRDTGLQSVSPTLRKIERERHPQVRKWTVSTTDVQQEEVRALQERLNNTGGSCDLSELQRMAFNLLLELATGGDDAVAKRLYQQRRLEKRYNYGWGNRPRKV